MHLCDCRECDSCCMTPGPAAYKAVRDGRTMHLCTRCNLSTDRGLTLIIEPNADLEPYARWDALGYFCLIADLSAMAHPAGSA